MHPQVFAIQKTEAAKAEFRKAQPEYRKIQWVIRNILRITVLACTCLVLILCLSLAGYKLAGDLLFSGIVVVVCGLMLYFIFLQNNLNARCRSADRSIYEIADQAYVEAMRRIRDKHKTQRP